jgi:hypothetical protein
MIVLNSVSLKYKWLCYQRWLMSAPIQRYAHQANPRIVLLDVEILDH